MEKITAVLPVIKKSTWLNTEKDLLQILEKFGKHSTLYFKIKQLVTQERKLFERKNHHTAMFY